MGNSDVIDLQNNPVDLVNQLAVLLRTAQIHSMKNHAVLSLIDKFVSVATDILKNEQTLTLKLRGEYFYLNDMRIRYSPNSIMNIDFLLREFRKTEIGAIIIRPGIDHDEMQLFVKLILASSSLEHPFDKISEELSSINNIDIHRIKNTSEEKTVKDIKKLIRNTYFSAVSYAKAIFNTVQTGEKVNLKKSKRVVASLVDRVIDHEQLLLGMTVIKDYDEYTYFHSTNVSILSVALGQKLGLNRSMLIELGIVAFFHDIGKIEVPNEILNKPGRLNDAEWRIITNHPKWGVKALMNMRELDDLTLKSAIVAFEHHMNFDLSGYPKLTHPFALDLYSKIVTISDQYDAMTSARIYSKIPMSQDKALSFMMEKSGKEIDPLIFKFFVNLIGIYPLGTLVKLDTNELGIVFENNHLFLSRPRVMIISDKWGNMIEGYVVDLTKKDSVDNYIWSITKTMNPRDLNINLADYFL